MENDQSIGAERVIFDRVNLNVSANTKACIVKHISPIMVHCIEEKFWCDGKSIQRQHVSDMDRFSALTECVLIAVDILPKAMCGTAFTK